MITRIFILIVFAGSSLSIWAGEAISIDRFGKKGDLTPGFMGQPMPDSFFETHRTRSLTSAYNYTANLALPVVFGTRNKAPGQHIPDQMWELIVSNQNEFAVNVVLSATRNDNNAIRNFLLYVPEQEMLTLDISTLTGYHDLHLISMHGFEAWFDAYREQDLHSSQTFAVKAPSPEVLESERNRGIRTKAPNYCRDAFALKRIVGQTAAVWARFKRALHPTNPVGDEYWMEVHYPNAGDLFHVTTSRTAFIYSFQCYTDIYHTEQVSSGAVNHWFNMDDVMLYNQSGWACRNEAGCSNTNYDFWITDPF